MRFDDFVADVPLLHTWDNGQTWNTGGFDRSHLEPMFDFLKARLPPAPTLLETGAGNSTLCFLFLKPKRLVSIAPDKELFDRILSYCRVKAIAADTLEAHVDGSEWVLPMLALGARAEPPMFDFVLIDGCHNWPLVFLDFFYANYLLKPGGYLMIDDLQLHSVKELARLLSEQPGFETALHLGKSRIFRRVSSARSLGEWTELPYIVRRSEEYRRLANPFGL